ncbi:hypothetical protein ACFQY4_36700 [Catellatospora bangladeshensis]|uniref:Lipopolysaccharide assembly protein A domain-containing protein n=1 Tax=Catellatospora bangladeshensis TaxID=310355 RepID=A0A8J3JEJ6_9ACTN|nr:hypothetical protein [Catellatospora bangladeshensis]GIF81164.1 hypothetical protein Cba03nite_25130 [Catellatospora bangladeshensis]
MILIGLLLVLGLSGLALAAFMNNDGLYTAPAGTVELFGYSVEATVGQVFLTGAVAGALVLIGLFIMFGGACRRARRRMAARRELAEQRAEMRDLQRKHDSMESELAANRARETGAADAQAVMDAKAAAKAREAEKARADADAEVAAR